MNTYTEQNEKDKNKTRVIKQGIVVSSGQIKSGKVFKPAVVSVMAISTSQGII